MQSTVRGTNPITLKLQNRLRHQGNMQLAETRQEIVAEQHPLTTELISRRQFRAQNRIRHRRRQILQRHALQQTVPPGAGPERIEQKLAIQIQIKPQRLAIKRHMLEQRQPPRRIMRITPRHQPVRRPLKYIHVAANLGQFR